MGSEKCVENYFLGVALRAVHAKINHIPTSVRYKIITLFGNSYSSWIGNFTTRLKQCMHYALPLWYLLGIVAIIKRIRIVSDAAIKRKSHSNWDVIWTMEFTVFQAMKILSIILNPCGFCTHILYINFHAIKKLLCTYMLPYSQEWVSFAPFGLPFHLPVLC